MTRIVARCGEEDVWKARVLTIGGTKKKEQKEKKNNSSLSPAQGNCKQKNTPKRNIMRTRVCAAVRYRWRREKIIFSLLRRGGKKTKRAMERVGGPI
ncbi:hypothetical protein TNCV_2889921 [Trichonephila clavipes]|nr:hypothetical protein TNCV_2889921 [Trichonephila clavipes]